MSRNRKHHDWFERLDQLADQLDRLDAPDPEAIAALVVAAAEARDGRIAVGTPAPDPAASDAATVVVPIDLGSGKAGWLLLDFETSRDVPPSEVVTSLGRHCGRAWRAAAARSTASATRDVVDIGRLVADAVVGLADAEALAASVAAVLPVTLATAVDVVRSRTVPSIGRHDIAVGPIGGVSLIVRRVGAPEPDEAVVLDTVAEVLQRAMLDAAAIDDQRRMRRILERSLLPAAFVPVDGLQLASRYLPAGRGHEAGGDFYDAVVGPAGVTVMVGDVQGKGVEAATLTSLARHTLRAGALDGASPATLLHQLNRALLYGQREQRSTTGAPAVRFVTVAIALLAEVDDGFDVAVARGGHPPPIVIRPDGDVELVEPAGVLLGVVEAPEFEEHHIHLGRADTLVLYSDGVTEQRRSQRPFDEVELGRLVRHQLGVVDAEAIADAIRDTVLLVSPEEVRDDIAVVVACVRERAGDGGETGRPDR